MRIPLSYNLRNMVVRKTTTIMTALGIALTVAVLLSMLALVTGLRVTLATTGDPLHILVLRKGSTSEIVSNFARTAFQDLKFKPGIAVSKSGQPMASLELITAIALAGGNSTNGMNLTLRGLPQTGIEMRSNVKLVSGRWFREGQREIAVGRSVAERYPAAQLGKKIAFGHGDWEIVGVFESGTGAQGSEIWGNLDTVAADLDRMPVLSSALLEATDAVTVKALIDNINNDQRLNMNAQTEQEFYAAQTTNAAPIEYVGTFIAVIMAIGSSFAAMNTMYAAVARRAREIGTLRVLGFSRGSILFSFFIESLLISAIGGVLGCLMALMLNGRTSGIGTGNFTETAFQFSVTPQLMAAGIGFAVLMGAIGGLFPARMASRKEILSALREI